MIRGGTSLRAKKLSTSMSTSWHSTRRAKARGITLVGVADAEGLDWGWEDGAELTSLHLQRRKGEMGQKTYTPEDA